tara:strand:- start:3118 stop:5043 length:1926 start_codon:yes stop_codon:yes gene_type:complete
MALRLSLVGFFVLFLQACGGSSAPAPTPIPDQLPSANTPVSAKLVQDGLRLYYPESFWVNQAASLAVTADSGNIKSVYWQQSSGPELIILAPDSQLVSFDITQAASYSIDLTVTLNTGVVLQKNITFNALDNTQALSSIRLDHVVVEQGKVSLRVDSTGSSKNKAIRSIQWRQIAGPEVSDLVFDEHYLFFVAPNVAQDVLVEFSATLNFTDGSVASDQSYVLVKKSTINPDGYFPKFAERIVTTEVRPYISDGQYADVLVGCVYNNQISSSCTFETLPLIGSQTPSPSIDDILARLVVSHPWMGDRFKEFLQESATSEDMRQLLKATTAIVIAYDVRPSFYWSATGAIYLDAANFWRSPQERDTLNDQADYRSNFGNELQFIIPWRYVKNNQYYIRNSDFPAESRLSKPFSALEANASWLMYHELGHANDFFPYSSWASLSNNDSPLSYANNHDASSSQFSQAYPLDSIEMVQLADVSFSGITATESQKALVAQDVVGFFSPDKAPDYYCYSTIREDFATLFGHFMMAYRLSVSADVAIISSVDNDELKVTWGQRDRVNSTQIQPRVKAVVESIFPQLNVAQIQTTLPRTLNMRVGDDWFSNINLSVGNNSNTLQAKSNSTKPLEPSDFWQVFPHTPTTP